MTLSVKTAVRIVSFVSALLLIMLGIVIANTVQTNAYRRQMQSGYVRSVQEIASYTSSISSQLQKASYTGTAPQMAVISAGVWKDAGAAKAALGNLPVTEINLDSTYRFLSQVGDYAMYLSHKSALGEELTNEERDNLEKLGRYASQFHRHMAGIERVVSSGSMDVDEYLRTQLSAAEDGLAQTVQANLGFQDVEAGFDGYPTLIYDGPFSDNLLEKSPQMTKDLPEIPRTQAKEIAAKFARLAPEQLEAGEDELSRMPSYTFHGGDMDVGVTKNGGYVTYLLGRRAVGAHTLDLSQARRTGQAYLGEMGLGSLRESYYELAGGILTINYAHMESGVICYTDLVKVGVAMDNGDILFYDARGYLNNHRERNLETPVLTARQAAQSVSPALKVRDVRQALIPTPGGQEVLTYEFACYGTQGEDVLVYVNTVTGAEEQILMLIENEYGTLAI